MFTIQKDLNGIFWHIYNNLKTKVNVSDFDVVIDDVANTFIIQCKNGSNIPNQAISISLIQVIDLSVGTSPIPFIGANGLIQLLTAKGYTPYLQVPPSVSVVVYRVGQVGVFTMTPTQFTDNFTETGLGTNTMLGWALRNGNNGTKNQQGKFSLNKGASPYDVIGTIGGSPNAVLIGHKHTFSGSAAGTTGGGAIGTGNVDEGAGSFLMTNTGLSENGASVPDQSGVGKNMPPYLIDVWVERVTELVINSGSGVGGGVQSVTGTTVDNTDPLNPIVGVPTLQEITDNESGTSVTTGNMQVNALIATEIGAIDVDDSIILRPQGLSVDFQRGSNQGQLNANGIDNNYSWELPNASGKIALTSDIPTNKENITTATTGAVISFATPQVYNSIASPSSSNLTDNLTGARIGVVQKIYHNAGTAPTVPAGWVLRGTGSYVTSTLNIIYAEWSVGTTVEYWITQ